MITRDILLHALSEGLYPLDYYYALWLEGADANGSLDAYSDLDLWADFMDEREKEAIDAVESILTGLARLDEFYLVDHPHPKIRQRVYHLEGSPPSLMIDFCWQLHSRDMGEFAFYRNDRIENAKVLFDKASVVRFTDTPRSVAPEEAAKAIAECQYRYRQHCRVEKYILRGQYPEAFAYYQRYVVEPLVTMLRLRDTPAYYDYGLVHLSSHVSVQDRERIEYFLKVDGLEEIRKKMAEATLWFQELTDALPASNQWKLME